MSAINIYCPVLQAARIACHVLLLFSLTITCVFAAPPEWVEGQLIVKPKAGLSEAQFEKILSHSKGQSIKHLKQINTRVIRVPRQAEEAVLRALSNNPNIDFAEKDMLVSPDAITPDDPNYSSQWHLPKIQAPDAWELSTGNGITVAILDTGVESSHPDLVNNLVPGWNVASNNSDTSPVMSHGTRVAGVVAATGNNATGVASVAWDAKIMPIRISNESNGQASWSVMAEGFLWAADHGADVANMSYGLSTNSNTINSAAQYLRSKGGLAVVAAGNDNIDRGFNDNPYLITVAATTSSDARASFSNFGANIDVAAPGSSIYTTNTGGGYRSASGTSYASPATAGVVALIMAANSSLSPDDVEGILEDSAVDLGNTGWDKYFGYGRVNAASAVQLATGGAGSPPPDTEPPAVNISAPANGAVVSGTAAVDVTASDNKAVDRVELFADGQKVGSDSTKPYSFSWNSTGKAGGAQVTLTARAADAAGNVSNHSITVVIAVTDSSPPVVTAPPAVSKEADGALTSVNLGTATANDDEDGAVTVTVNYNGPFAVGLHTVVWSATDSAGNTGTANQQITITDNTPPVVSPPDKVIVQATGDLTSANLGQGTALDKVDGVVTATPNNYGPFPVGVTIIIWRASDSAGNTGSALQTVTVTQADDIMPPVISVPANKTVEATDSLTSVNIGQATAVDDIDGTVEVSASNPGPFAVGVHHITWTARDQAGNLATADQTVTVRDTTKPSISIPSDVSVGATGHLTEVNLGNVTADDAVSGSITPVVDPIGPYASGAYTLSWTATDAAGNRGQATQRLSVKPQATLAVNQTVGEGNVVTVDVFLGGSAPAYPVSIPYIVSGTASNPADHNAASGVITINSGIAGKRVFNTVDDGFTGEADETVIFEIQTPTNAVLGSRRKHTVTIIEGNAPPRVDLGVEQQDTPVRVVYTDDGLVQVIADVSDPDTNDRHSFDWSETDNRLFDTGTGGADSFIFDPQFLSEGVYAVKVNVTDNGEPAETASAEVLISVSQPETTLSGRDQDGDGIPDAEEGTGDGDQDGVPDYLDAIADPAILQSVEAVSDRALLMTEPGLGLRLGGTALAAGYYGASISLRDIEVYAAQAGVGVNASVASSLVFPGGLYDFEITGLRQAGQSVKVVIPQAASIGADAVYRKYRVDSGWQDFVENAQNIVASAAGNPDSCPAPGSAAYQSGLQQGHYCVQLTLQDGGPNDADGQANGVVKDPGGIGLSPQSADDVIRSASGSGGGGGGGCIAGTRGGFDPLLPLMVLLSVLGLGRSKRTLM